MTVPRSHPRLWIAATAAAAVLAALGLLAGTLGSVSRGALLGALERPARPAATSIPSATIRAGRATLRAGEYAAGLRISPNRAGARNRVSLALALRGRPVTGASVQITFGMPAMGMADAFGSSLSAGPGRAYAANEPVLGMPGLWILRFHVVPAHGTPFDLVVDDLLAS